jgi:hypothetical protein
MKVQVNMHGQGLVAKKGLDKYKREGVREEEPLLKV